LPTHSLFWAHDKPIIILDKVPNLENKNTFFLELGKKIIGRVGKFEKKNNNKQQQYTSTT